MSLDIAQGRLGSDTPVKLNRVLLLASRREIFIEDFSKHRLGESGNRHPLFFLEQGCNLWCN